MQHVIAAGTASATSLHRPDIATEADAISATGDLRAASVRHLVPLLESVLDGRADAAACAILQAAAETVSDRVGEIPVDIVARPPARGPLAWHLDRLCAALARPAGDTGRPLRVRYHARWAWHFVAPDDERGRPRVSVIIPVFDRAEAIRRAVESCLDQSYPPAEIIVVDDGSRDSPASALADLGDRVVVLRQEANRGVAAARNLGLSRATGEFVHFLDSDDRLTRDAIAAKIAALRHVADAEICYCGFREEGTDGRPRAPRELPVPPREPPSPVWDSRNLLHQHAFLVGAVMIARHLIVEIGPFDEWLRKLEDTRYWQRLGHTGAKIIAVDRDLLLRQATPGSLSRSPVGGHPWDTGVVMMGAADCLAYPQTWRAGWQTLGVAMGTPEWSVIRDPANEFAQPFQEYVCAALRRLPEIASANGLSAIPLAATLERLITARLRGRPGGRTFEAEMLAAIDEARQRSVRPTAADVRFWLARPMLSKEVWALIAAGAAQPEGLTRRERALVRLAHIAAPLLGPSITRQAIALFQLKAGRAPSSARRRSVGTWLRVAAVPVLAIAGAIALAQHLGWLGLALLVAGAAGALLGVAGAALLAYRAGCPPFAPRIVGARLAGRRPTVIPLALGGMSANLIDAVVAAEDSRFLQHRGVDPAAVRETIDEYLAGGRLRGASTITMQLVRNLFLWRGRSLFRKGAEVVLALLAERLLPKRRILELYLNVAEWGRDLYGAEAAAQTHFGKRAADLSLDEAALLAAALPSPRRRDPARPSLDLRRQARVIARRAERMRAVGEAFSIGPSR